MELEALSSLISDNIAAIKSSLAAKNLAFPSPRTPFTPQTEAARMQPEVARAADTHRDEVHGVPRRERV